MSVMAIKPELGSLKKPAIISLADIVVLTGAAVILCLPVLLYGPMVKGHDTFEHLNYCRHFAEQFWSGDWYPRWLINMNHGLGTPTLFVYPPFASYLYALLQPAGNWLHFDVFRVVEFLALLTSGISAFLWLRTMATRGVALAGAVLYMLMPYHLAIDFYRRTALSECWALAWMPLVLYFATPEIVRKRTALVGLAVVYACLILSHLVSVLIFSLLPLTIALLFSESGKRIGTTIRVAAGMALGTGLSCFYFLPALYHAKYFPVMNLLSPPYYVLEENFLGLDDIIHGGAKIGFVHWVSLTTIGMVAFMAIAGGAVLARGRSESKQKVVFWLAACVIPLFLLSRLSLPVWRLLPPLFKSVQYPWRFNIVLCVAGLLISAMLLTELPQFSRAGAAVLVVILSLIVLTWAVTYGQVWMRYRTDVYEPVARLFVNEDDGWFDAWTAPGLDQLSALHASKKPRARFADTAENASDTAEVRVWKARHIEVRSQSSSGGWLIVNQFYYPMWTAISGSGQTLQLKPVLPEGLIEIQVPPGHQDIRLEIPEEPVERAGRWISAGCMLLCAVLVGWRKPGENLIPA